MCTVSYTVVTVRSPQPLSHDAHHTQSHGHWKLSLKTTGALYLHHHLRLSSPLLSPSLPADSVPPSASHRSRLASIGPSDARPGGSGQLTPTPFNGGESPSSSSSSPATSAHPGSKQRMGTCPVPHSMRVAMMAGSGTASNPHSPASTSPTHSRGPASQGVSAGGGSGAGSPTSSSAALPTVAAGCPAAPYLRPVNAVAGGGNRSTRRGMEDWLLWFQQEGAQILAGGGGGGGESPVGEERDSSGGSASAPTEASRSAFMMAVIVKAHELFHWDEVSSTRASRCLETLVQRLSHSMQH